MVLYISIGYTCNSKYQIDKHNGIQKVIFFDGLMISMESVMDVMACDDINSIVNVDSIVPIVSLDNLEGVLKTYNVEREYIKNGLYFNKLDLCVALHDVDNIGTLCDEIILLIIEKYKRRYARLMEHIHGNQKIYFLRTFDCNDEMADKFIQFMKNKFPLCDFTLIVVHVEQDNDDIVIKDNYIKVNFKEKKNNDWTTSYIEWNRVFRIVES